MDQQLHVRVRHEDGSYWATVDELPGVFATGDTIDELRESVTEGVALVLAEPGGPVPDVTLGEFQQVGQVATADLVYA